MTWFKVDDTLAGHPKARKAGLPAMGLWTVAGSWASQQLTDGFVPGWYVETWPQGRKLAARLVDARLWNVGEHDGEPGWWFHEWEHANPLREQVLRDREAARLRQQRRRDTRVSHREVTP